MYKIILLTCALLLWFSSFAAIPSSAAPTIADRDTLFWESIQDSPDVDEYELYLQKYPQGEFADLARFKIKQIRGKGNAETAQPPTQRVAEQGKSAGGGVSTESISAKNTDNASSVAGTENTAPSSKTGGMSGVVAIGKGVEETEASSKLASDSGKEIKGESPGPTTEAVDSKKEVGVKKTDATPPGKAGGDGAEDSGKQAAHNLDTTAPALTGKDSEKKSSEKVTEPTNKVAHNRIVRIIILVKEKILEAWDSIAEFWKKFTKKDDTKKKDSGPLPGDKDAATTPTKAERETLFWQSVKDSPDVDEYELYLQKYPQGEFVDLARLKIKQLKNKGGSEAAQGQTQRVTDQGESAGGGVSTGGMHAQNNASSVAGTNNTPLPATVPSASSTLTNLDQAVAVLLRLADSTNDIQISEAIASIEALPKPTKGNRKVARKLNEQGLQLLSSGDTTGAVEILRQAVTADPSDQEITNNLAHSYLQVEKFPEAERELSNTLLIAPRRSAAWADLGYLYAKTSDMTMAVKAFQQAYRFSSNQKKTIEFLHKHEEDPDLQVREAAQRTLAAVEAQEK